MAKLKFRGIKIEAFEGKRADYFNTELKKKKFIYYVRHDEDDWGKPISIEVYVYSNTWGVIIADKSLKKFMDKEIFKYGMIELTKKESILIGRSCG